MNADNGRTIEVHWIRQLTSRNNHCLITFRSSQLCPVARCDTQASANRFHIKNEYIWISCFRTVDVIHQMHRALKQTKISFAPLKIVTFGLRLRALFGCTNSSAFSQRRGMLPTENASHSNFYWNVCAYRSLNSVQQQQRFRQKNFIHRLHQKPLSFPEDYWSASVWPSS